jgi:hypothetical protein
MDMFCKLCQYAIEIIYIFIKKYLALKTMKNAQKIVDSKSENNVNIGIATKKGSRKPSLFKKTGISKLIYITVFLVTFTNCEKTEEEALNNSVQNNLVVTVGDFDNDGVKDDIRVKNTVSDADADDKISQTITVGNQSTQADARVLEKDFFNIAKGNMDIVAVSTDTKSEDTDVKTVTIEEEDIDPQSPSDVSNANPTVDENSTDDIDLGITNPNGVESVGFDDASNNKLAEYFNLVDNNTLVLKKDTNSEIIKPLNHEIESEIKDDIVVKSKTGAETKVTITVKLNDIFEPQNADVFGDGGMLPNGEKYAIYNVDESESTDGLSEQHYNHGSDRRSEADIKKEIVDSSATYGSASISINALYGTNLGPMFADGQRMLTYDEDAREMVVHAENGDESARIERSLYGKMMLQIKKRTGNDDNIQFTQDGTNLNIIWREMIELQARHPDKLYRAVDKAIQNGLTAQ